MQSFYMHSFPFCSNIVICNSNSHPPFLPHSSRHYPSPRDDAFSNALLSLRKCTANEDSNLGFCHHARAQKLGIKGDVFIGNSLLNMYSKCGLIKDAENLFDEMPLRTVVSWTTMMSAYHQIGEAEAAIELFGRMLEFVRPNEYALAVVLQACSMTSDADLVQGIHCCAVKNALVLDDFLRNCLIDAYAKLGMFEASEKLLGTLCCRDVVSWTSVISGCVKRGNAKRALSLFLDMQEDGICPNDVTILAVLQACSDIGDYNIMQWIHGWILKGNWCANGLLLNSLIEMYAMNGVFSESVLVFCCFCFNNGVLYPSSETMAKLLQGCANKGTLKLGKGIHGYLIKHGFLPCLVVENSLINMYAKNGQEYSPLLLFRKMEFRDLISWNTIISGFVNNGEPNAALGLLLELHREGSRENIYPDFVTMLVSLEACSNLAFLLQGQVIHGYLVRTGLLGDIFVQNALIDMYARSGKLDLAENIYTEMHKRDIGTWNSIISAYGINGNTTSALNTFYHLVESATIKPNAITFVNILTACAHAGMVHKGFEIFNSMEGRFGVKPSMEHFACMVDLLGRAGRVDEAERFIQDMPIQAGADVWGALLNACVLTSNIAIAEKAAKELAVLQPNSSIWRVALSNAYAGVGRWDNAAEIRAELRESKELIKAGGWSSVDIGGSEFSFMAGDTKCPQSAVIYEIIAGLQNHMRDGSLICSEFVLS